MASFSSRKEQEILIKAEESYDMIHIAAVPISSKKQCVCKL